MSLTIRMRRALAAFRADPNKPMPQVMVPVSIALRVEQVAPGEVEDTEFWKIHSDYHRSRIIHGKRLNWHTNGKGNQSAQYGTTMYYGSNLRRLFRGLGLKDTW